MEQNKINGQLYRQVFVRSEADLPKEDEKYYFHTIGNFTLRFCSPCSATFRQIKKHIDWYLQPKQPLWDNSKVIDFVNWYLRLCFVRERFQLENQDVIESFLKGDDYKVWWRKVRDMPEQPKNIEQTSDDYYNRDRLFEKKK